MKRTLLITVLIALIGQISYSQNKIWDETPDEKTERLAWWTEARFGLFIHWGTYSLAARHEKVVRRENIPQDKYQIYFDHFNPDLFDPVEWAQKAKAAGMKYAVITTKHHEGFSLFDSDFSDYKVTNSPYGKDILREWVDAFRAEGLKIGFYYSLIDWHHPEYTVDNTHTTRLTTDEEYEEANKNRDMSKYREFAKNQITEILTNYGQVDIFWMDYSFPGKHGKGRDEWGSIELMKLVRKLQPGIIVNDRADLKDIAGGWDFTTPEQFKVKEWPTYNGEKVPWETCQTFATSWGYYRDEFTWKNKRQLLVLLIETVSKGGNLLLNVGPTGRGTIDYRAQNALSDMGEWMKFNSRSIYGCTEAPEEFEQLENSLMTYNPETNRLYIHLLEYPIQNFTLKKMKGKVEYVQFLHDASEIQIREPHGFWENHGLEEGDINLSLPVIKPNIEIPVIEVFLK